MLTQIGLCQTTGVGTRWAWSFAPNRTNRTKGPAGSGWCLLTGSKCSGQLVGKPACLSSWMH